MKAEEKGTRVKERHSTLCVEEAEDVVKELRALLAKTGIALPSLGLDPVSLRGRRPVRSSTWGDVPWRPHGGSRP
ncbi:hypothetical protein SHIRM173S_00819 [Streptomyces hirsutus]